MAARSRPKKLPLVLQAEALRKDFPSGTVRCNHKRLEWVGNLQPTPFSDVYTVKLVYLADGRRPTVTVVSPALVPNEDGKLPHIFPGRGLCLHSSEDWHAGLFITRSVVPWTSEWLLHYEFWRATDEWSGGGHEPTLYRVDATAAPKLRSESKK